MKFTGMVIVITGAGSSIGRACANDFGKEGATIVVADVNKTGAHETIKQIAAENGEAISYEPDVADPAAVRRFSERIFNNYGRLDVLVNNAAIQVNKTVGEISVDEWNGQLSVNLGGVFCVANTSFPFCVSQKRILSTCLR